MNNNEITAIICKYPREERFSLGIMQDLQRQFNYVPREGMEMIAEYLSVPLSDLYSMATFYKALSLKPKGEFNIKLCDGTACHIRGSQQLIDGLYRILGLHPGETTQDGKFSIETVNCVGSCAQAPVVVINEECYGKMTQEKLIQLIKNYGGESYV